MAGVNVKNLVSVLMDPGVNLDLYIWDSSPNDFLTSSRRARFFSITCARDPNATTYPYIQNFEILRVWTTVRVSIVAAAVVELFQRNVNFSNIGDHSAFCNIIMAETDN
jgi:hypothetical protein